MLSTCVKASRLAAQSTSSPPIGIATVPCAMKLLILALCIAAAAAAPTAAHRKPPVLCPLRNCYCAASYTRTPVNCTTCTCVVSRKSWSGGALAIACLGRLATQRTRRLPASMRNDGSPDTEQRAAQSGNHGFWQLVPEPPPCCSCQQC